MILIINKDGWRLCNDGRWRDFAMFGSVNGCVKEYKCVGNARRRAKHIGGTIVQIPEGMLVEASGLVIETIPTKPGYERVVHHKLNEFVGLGPSIP